MVKRKAMSGDVLDSARPPWLLSGSVREKYCKLKQKEDPVKKTRKPKFENLDSVMLTWFHMQRRNNVPVSGPILKTKAEQYPQQLGTMDFKGSEGWLGKF